MHWSTPESLFGDFAFSNEDFFHNIVKPEGCMMSSVFQVKRKFRVFTNLSRSGGLSLLDRISTRSERRTILCCIEIRSDRSLLDVSSLPVVLTGYRGRSRSSLSFWRRLLRSLQPRRQQKCPNKPISARTSTYSI